MGGIYERNGSGRRCCDVCGQPGGVRQRTCPHTVLGDSHRAVDGQRHRMPWCKPPALCDPCMTAVGGNAKLHESCKEGAAKAQAEDDRTEALLDAGELLVCSAITDDDRAWVRVTFCGRQDAGRVTVLVPAADYDPRNRPALSDYPTTRELVNP